MTVEEIFAGLAEAEGLPREAMAEAGRRRDEMVPAFLDLIHRLGGANVDTVADDDAAAFLFAFYLLGEWREARAYRPLADLLRHDPELLELVLGDAATMATARVMAALYDGDLGPILEVLSDRAADMFLRSQMIDALVLIAEDHPERRPDVVRCLETFPVVQADAPDVVWDGWAFAIAALGLADLEPLVADAFRNERIPPDLSTVDHFREALGIAAKTGTADWRRRTGNTHPIESAIEELSDWHCFSEAARRSRPAFPDETFAREVPKVGRNDPCPCGSGKKYKKCCLH